MTAPMECWLVAGGGVTAKFINVGYRYDGYNVTGSGECLTFANFGSRNNAANRLVSI